MSNLWKMLLLLLSLIALVIWLTVLTYIPNRLKLIACDVGQGDAILAVYGSFEILTDGGIPNGKVSECLSRYMPFWDRTIEVIVNTHPQLDHYGGLIEVMQNYNVQYFVGNSLDASASEYQVLKGEVGSRGIKVINPHSGISIRYRLIHYDIFAPSTRFLADNSVQKENRLNNNSGQILGVSTSKNDPNDFSVEAILTLDSFNALLTGDIGHNMAKDIIPMFSEFLKARQIESVEYIKVPHHGSKYGMTGDYLEVINPKIAVISVGAKNRYGHPTDEILKILSDKGIDMFRTDLNGDVIMESDGESYKVINK